jgi:hypothetical protein
MLYLILKKLKGKLLWVNKKVRLVKEKNPIRMIRASYGLLMSYVCRNSNQISKTHYSILFDLEN